MYLIYNEWFWKANIFQDNLRCYITDILCEIWRVIFNDKLSFICILFSFPCKWFRIFFLFILMYFEICFKDITDISKHSFFSLILFIYLFIFFVVKTCNVSILYKIRLVKKIALFMMKNKTTFLLLLSKEKWII